MVWFLSGYRAPRATRPRIAPPPLCESIETRAYLSVSLASPSATAVPGATGPIVSAQFNGSKNPGDLAVATSGAVQILLGNIIGTFSLGGKITLPTNAPSQTPFLVGNFNGTGADIVLLSRNTVTHNGTITDESSHNDGTFSAAATSVIVNNGHGFTPITAAVGNFDSDTHADLAVIGKPTTGTTLVLAFLISNGDGSFTEEQDLPITGSLASGNLTGSTILTGDFGNGQTDIAIYDGTSANLDVFMGAGNDTFTQLTPVHLTATTIVAGKFTSIPRIDLIAANGAQLTPLLGNGNGTFNPLPTITLGGTITSLASGDIDLDGNLDLITNLGILPGIGDGTFAATIPLPSAEGGSTFTSPLIAADLDGDKRLDIAGISTAGNSILTALNLSPVPSFVVVTSNPSPASPGQDVKYTATISSELNLAASGQVDFFDNGNPIGTAIVQEDGTATFDAGATLSVGHHSITAQFEGDSNFNPDTSTPFDQRILAPSTTAVVSNLNPSNAGDSVTFTATVSGNDGGDIPGGSVEFFDGVTDLGGGALDPSATVSIHTSALAGGVHAITANYHADANFAPSTSAPLLQTVVVTQGLFPLVTASTLPAAVVGGAPARGIVTVQLSNNTSSVISGPVSITVFASISGSVSGATPVIALPEKPMVLLANSSQTLHLLVKSLPATLPDGTYKLIAQVVYNAGTTIAATDGPSIHIAAPFISLAESSPVVKLPLAVVSGTAANGSIRFLITNSGNIPSKGATTFALTASLTPDQPGAAVANLVRNLNIRPGAAQPITLPIRTIPVVANGNYFLVLKVTDPNGGISIKSSATTTTIAAPFISLTATLGPVINVNSGDTVTITNNGNIDELTSFNPALGFSTDPAGAQPAGSGTVVLAGNIHVKAGKTARVHLNQWKTFLSSLAPGTPYYLTMTITDDRGNSAFAVSSTTFTL